MMRKLGNQNCRIDLGDNVKFLPTLIREGTIVFRTIACPSHAHHPISQPGATSCNPQTVISTIPIMLCFPPLVILSHLHIHIDELAVREELSPGKSSPWDARCVSFD